MDEMQRHGVRRAPGGIITRRGILAALGGLGLASPLGLAKAKPHKKQTKRKDRQRLRLLPTQIPTAPLRSRSASS